MVASQNQQEVSVWVLIAQLFLNKLIYRYFVTSCKLKPSFMRIQRIFGIAALVMVLSLAAPLSATASNPTVTTTTTDPRAQELIQRLNEIKAIDKSTLSKSERKALRKEVISIKKEMKAISGGVYLSVGAIIIIILVLILIL